MKGYNYFFVFLFCFSIAGAQVDTNDLKTMNARDLKKIGKNAMLQNDPNSAIIYLERCLKLNKNDYQVQFLLAECYRKTRDYEKAEKMYAAAYKSNPEKNITALYWHAEMLKTFNQYEKAKEEFIKFKKSYRGNDRKIKKSAAKEVVACDSAKMLLIKETKIVVQHLDTGINKINVEASPFALADTEIVFSSLRTDKKLYVLEGDTSSAQFRRFYTAKKIDGTWTFQGEWSSELNTDNEHNANAAFSPDGNRLYFSRCKLNWQGKMICAIYFSEKLNNGQWSEPVKLGKQINNPKYSNTQPTVAVNPAKGNEIVYFVSDRKGGKGSLDIWYFIYDKKKKVYLPPKNAGNKINTVNDEVTPFYDNESHNLYFSSDGHMGLGGMDVYKSSGALRTWTVSENIGQPVNSGADDIYYVVSKNREEGFLVSNRKGGNSIKNATCCDDIYEYKYTDYIHIRLVGKVFEQKDSVTAEALKDAKLELYLKDKVTGENILVKSIHTTEKGEYDLHLEADKDYFLVARKEGYLSEGGQEVSTKEIIDDKSIKQDFLLKPLPKEPIRIKNIQYEFDKAELTASSKTVLDTTIYRLLMGNPTIIIEISSHTDNKGSDTYNQKLSQKRAESVVNYLIAKGIDKRRLSAAGYGESKPVAPNQNPNGTDNPEGRQQNRRTEFRVIGELDVEVINEY